ncbi:hypothetical protein LBMAG42_20510 [Deltaproteobacteria bacterium]|nr:hypothetical protein LBMAG42_20510 [Deltaproteobacteria bacterium]
MIVPLADISNRGMNVSLGPWARAAAAEGVDGDVKAMEGSLELTRHGVHVAVRGELHVVGEVLCDRCRTPLVVSLGGDVSIVYSPVSTLPEKVDDEEGLPRPPVDVGFPVEDVGEFDGEKLDLAGVVREWATVERPARLMCRDIDEAENDACQARFLELSGQASPTTIDPRFSILSALKLKSED